MDVQVGNETHLNTYSPSAPARLGHPVEGWVMHLNSNGYYIRKFLNEIQNGQVDSPKAA
jgi:hypothetical protein